MPEITMWRKCEFDLGLKKLATDSMCWIYSRSWGAYMDDWENSGSPSYLRLALSMLGNVHILPWGGEKM